MYNNERDLRFFIVEDDPWYAEILNDWLRRKPGCRVIRFTSAAACLKQLHKQPDLIILDISLPDMNGDRLYEKIRLVNNRVPVIVISGQLKVRVAIDLVKKGVKEYLTKNEKTGDLLWAAINKLQASGAFNKKTKRQTGNYNTFYSFGNTLLGNSMPLKSVFGLMGKAAGTTINVSLTGETGTGRELAARAIHENSSRKDQPFVAVNMAAIPEALIESELFGHEQGAFTGADRRKVGKFEQANGGTLFLDEIAELSISLQRKLLRVLQEKEFSRVGGNEVIATDWRLIISTHKNLSREVRNGQFREDLFYRILGLTIEMPALRERGKDRLLLADFFIRNYARINQVEAPVLNEEARTWLMHYQFPGNIRELKILTERAVVLSNGKEITAAEFNYIPADERKSGKTLRQFTCERITDTLRTYKNEVPVAAEKLGISRSMIYKMIREKEIQFPCA